jgi:hypothetical protein
MYAKVGPEYVYGQLCYMYTKVGPEYVYDQLCCMYTKVGPEYVYGQLCYMYTKEVHFKSILITHYNLIDRSMNVPQSVLSPSSILPPHSSHCAFIPASKNSAFV